MEEIPGEEVVGWGGTKNLRVKSSIGEGCN